MEVTVYGDLLFFINTGMDALCLSLTAAVLHRKRAPLRIMLAAAMGGIYAVVSLFFTTGTLLALMLDIAVCLGMCLVAFGARDGIKRFFVAAGIYFLLSMVMGGVMTALYYLFNRIGLDTWLGGGEEGLGTWLFALLACLGGGVTLLGGRIFHRAGSVRTCELLIKMGNRTITLHGIVDTGNLLRDPMSGRAVICVDRQKLTPLLSEELRGAMEGGQLDALTAADARRVRLIPATGATGSRMLLGVVPDWLAVTYERKGREEHHEIDAIIAATEPMGEAEALLPLELLDT